MTRSENPDGRTFKDAPRPPPKLGLARIIAYGSGDFAFNLTFTFASLFLLYFYTDVLGLSGTAAGLIIMVALVWEGLTDPIAGLIANRTSSRWGRYRPYLLFGTIPLVISFSLMFLPLGLSGAALVAYAAVTHLVYRTVFTFVNVPYIALSAQMTSDSLVRGQIAGTRMIFAILCGIMLSALTLPLVKSFGGGVEGFFKLSLIYSVVAAAVLFLCFVSTSEAQSTTDGRHPSLGEMFDSVRRNRAFLFLLGATVLGAVAFTMSNKALVYYMKYVVGSEAAVTKGLLATLVTAAVAMVPWIMVTKRTSKRAVWMSGAAITSLGSDPDLCAASRRRTDTLDPRRVDRRGQRRFHSHVLVDAARYRRVWGMEKRDTSRRRDHGAYPFLPKDRFGRWYRNDWHPPGRNRLRPEPRAKFRDVARDAVALHSRPDCAFRWGGDDHRFLPFGSAHP